MLRRGIYLFSQSFNSGAWLAQCDRRHNDQGASPASTRFLGDGWAKSNELSCKADCKVRIYI